jgi:hypothetical protein
MPERRRRRRLDAVSTSKEDPLFTRIVVGVDCPLRVAPRGAHGTADAPATAETGHSDTPARA